MDCDEASLGGLKKEGRDHCALNFLAGDESGHSEVSNNKSIGR